MPTGSLLMEFELGPDEELRICSDDLADMFPSFVVPYERALTNAVAVKCSFGDFEGTKAAEALSQRLRAAGREPPHPASRVVAPNASMVMGDITAVDICMGAHERILEDTGVAFRPGSQVRGRALFPRSRHVEAVVVDDRVSLTAVPSGSRKPPAVAERSFREGGEALRRAGLSVHPDKGVRNAKHAAPLGIEIDGVRGRAGAERLRRHRLAHLSLCRWDAKVAGRRLRGGS